MIIVMIIAVILFVVLVWSLCVAAGRETPELPRSE
jgi:hypothetical protein